MSMHERLHERDEERARFRTVVDGGQSAVERALDALASRRSRYLLYCLAEQEQAELDDLAEEVAIRESECGRDQAARGRHERVRVDLYHRHLPKLADLDVVEYDERSGAVRYRNPPPRFEEFLDLCRDLDCP